MLSMSQVISSLLNEETRKKIASTYNVQALIRENKGRSKGKGSKGSGKFKGKSQNKEKSKKWLNAIIVARKES